MGGREGGRGERCEGNTGIGKGRVRDTRGIWRREDRKMESGEEREVGKGDGGDKKRTEVAENDDEGVRRHTWRFSY